MIEINPFANQTNQQANQGFAEPNQSNQTFNQQANFNQSQTQPKGLFQIPEKFLQLIP
jgi:hypothetical protein